MPEDLVTVAEFGDQTQAQAARNWLAENGIEARLDSETLASMGMLISEAGGFRVIVREEDADRAHGLLDSLKDSAGSDTADQAGELHSDEAATDDISSDGDSSIGRAMSVTMGVVFVVIFFYIVVQILTKGIE